VPCAHDCPSGIYYTGRVHLRAWLYPSQRRVPDVRREHVLPRQVSQSACPGNSTTNGQLVRENRSECVCDGGFYEADTVEGGYTLCGEDTFCADDLQFSCP